MKPSQLNSHPFNQPTHNSFKVKSVVSNPSMSNSTNDPMKTIEAGIAFLLIALRLLVLAALLVAGMCLTSCRRSHTTYIYKVQFITSGAKHNVIDVELGTETYGNYKVGDTVHVNRSDIIVTDGRYRKAIVIGIVE